VSHSIVNAVAYLQLTSLRNRIVQRLKRLRQPKYLFAAVVGVGYLYFFVFRQVLRGPGQYNARSTSPEFLPVLLSVAALILFVIVVLGWLLPSKRASLKFSEAETAFLFPAPLTRRMLIHFQLYRSQLSIFLSAFLMSLVFRRSGPFGVAAVMHAAGWWLLLSTMSLHFIGASFTRERLHELGVGNARRRLLIIGVVVLIAAICIFWLRGQVTPPSARDVADFRGIARYLGATLAMSPVSWLLAPFRVAIEPVFANDARSFWLAFAPAFALLLVHYLWVVRANIAFEEASLEGARRLAERRAARRSGKRGSASPGKPRSAPFKLAPRGFVPIAFLWRNLIALGPFYRLRTWLIACAVVLVGGRWLAASPNWSNLLDVFGVLAMSLGLASVFAGPMLMQRGLQQTLEYMDVLKASPLRGWQIVIGELLAPVTVMLGVQLLLLLTGAMAALAHGGSPWMAGGGFLLAAAAVALIAPPLCGLILCVPFAGLLFFPAWSATMASRQAGIEVAGQRMIFVAAYLLAMAVALIPAVVLGGIVFLLGRWLGTFLIGAVLATLTASAVLVVETIMVVWWLGERVERFDLSSESPRS
jgi:hypothetical protein